MVKKQQKKSSSVRKSTTKKPRQGLLASLIKKKAVYIPLIIVAMIGSFGVGATMFSKAVPLLNSEQCYLTGRIYKNGSCTKTCRSGAGTLQWGQYYDWCSKAISTSLSSSTCASKNRKFVAYTGCSRRWQQTNYTGAKQCTNSTYRYIVASIDYCKSTSTSTSSGGSTTGSDSWVWPLSVNSGVGAYGSGHYARDFRGTNGTDVRAVSDGVITKSGYISSGCGYGLIMKTKMANGTYLYPTYEHLKNYKAAGTSVSKGQVIAEIGPVPAGVNSCWTGYHLHLGVQYQGGSFESHRSNSSAHPDPCRWIAGC